MVPLIPLLLIPFVIITKSAGVPTPRIVNGSDASPGEFPYAVSIRYNNLHECGGSIIGESWVLTAAHCIYLDFVKVCSILFGSVDVQNGRSPSGFVREAEMAVVNENYQTYGGYFNDIGLIKVKQPFTFSPRVGSVRLPFQDEPVPRFKDSILVGWGYSVTNGTVMPILQKVHITIFPDDICEGIFQVNTSTHSHICTGLPQGGKGQCSGDSGGALTVFGTIYGIVSWSDKPCTITPGIMTRVPSYREWIRNITGI